MNGSRTLLRNTCSLLKLKSVSVAHFRNIVAFQSLARVPCHQYRLVNWAQQNFCGYRNNYRFRYSFIYSKKIRSVVSSKLSTYNGKGSGETNDFDNEAPLTKTQATELVLRLTEEERKFLLTALNEFESNQVKAEYEAENVPMPTTQQLLRVAVFNAVPFVGFGFLDNFIMIVAGDYIDETVGSIVTISTMAAAALGNTISDVMGIGSAWYVELAASKIGLKAPNLSPIQLDMKPARRSANLGRALGIVVGCLLGMTPLLFITKEEKKLPENASQ